MPSSASGGQLPLTVFLASRATQSGNRPGKDKGDKPGRKRAGSSTQAENREAPLKKRKQKENHDTSGKTSMRVSELEKHGSTSRAEDSLTMSQESSREHKQTDVPPSVKYSIPTDSLPATPEGQGRMHRPLPTVSLPSPPLTAPTSKRPRKIYEILTPDNVNLRRATLSFDGPSGENNESLSTGATAQVVGNKDAIVSQPPQRRGEMSMPPPPPPLRPSSTIMPARTIPRSPRSSSSDKWVPSSQTQELSISPPKKRRTMDMSSAIPHTPVDQETQVIPSSQSNERELQMSDVFPPTRTPGAYGTPASPLEAKSLSVSPLLPGRETNADHLETGFKAGLPSHEIVESSQSQYEHEISSQWADVIGSRKAALSESCDPREGDIDTIPSSPARPVRSQDYDANDEYSQSQDACSQSSTFGSSDPHTSPLRPVSPYTDSTSSYNPTPFPITPSQVRRFVNMFDGRDESGNELPDIGEGERSRSVSPSPASRRTPRHGEVPSPPRSPMLEAGSLRTGTPARVTRSTRMQDILDREDSELSSASQDYPTPVRGFLRIFEDRHLSS
ncbi:hypothetical protein C8Q73DRAFT_790942 [Cubamyces lactineus]|nr:hypothetical protein C8Q73DRAFT_790942 [Cubamyces lactineus]